MLLMLAAAWVAVIAALVARAIGQSRRYETLAPATIRLGPDLPLLSVIVPARNEALTIARCLDGLIAQTYPADRIEIIVIDDASSDGTAAIVRTLAARHARIRLIANGRLPDGWTGKSLACWRGASGALGDWLCFIDADIRVEPGLLAAALSAAQARGLGLLSLGPSHELVSIWERLIMPTGFLVAAVAQDLGRINDPRAAEASANGQFMLIPRKLYEAVDGHRATRAEIHEDRALAGRIKQAGGRIALCGGEHLMSTRMFTDLRSLWRGGGRNLIGILGSARKTALVALAALLLGWAAVALPLVTALAVTRNDIASIGALALACAGTLILLGIHVGCARYFRIPTWHALLFPVGYSLAAALGFSAAFGHMRGHVIWKGRRYPAELRRST